MKLLAPNGKPSKLNPKQYKLVRTPEFKAWFGDWENSPETASKVVDENGEPLPVYHGTSAEPFVVFDGGSFFTDDYMNADGYASGEMVYEVFLNIKKPLIINARGRKWDNLKNKYGNSTRDIVGQLDMDKYDGVIFNNINDNWFDDEMGETQNVYFSINSEQIKLSDGTNTTFDANNPDIRYEQGGVVTNELAKIKESYDFGFEYFEGEIYGQDYKIRMNKNHPRNAYRNDDQFIHNLSLVNVEYPSAVVFREENNKIQIQKDKIYSWEDAESEIREFFYEIEDRSNQYKKGGYVKPSKTPAPKKERIYGSKVNKPKSSASKSKASSIILSPKVIKSINSILEKHNEKSNKKIPLATAKAVVRRGMGAYSSTHRPTISGGKPNSRVAWGLARLNAFVFKIQKGYSKSGKYIQDDDLINELGYRVKKYENGGTTDYKYFVVTKNEKEIFVVRFLNTDDKTSDMIEMIDKLTDRGYILKEITKDKYENFDSTKVSKADISEFMSGTDYYESGGNVSGCLSVNELEKLLGRKINIFNENIVNVNGILYQKVFLKLEYKRISF